MRFLLVLVVLMPRAAGAQVEGLPPEHWAYEELEHFEARGVLQLHGFRPYSRAEVREWVLRLREWADVDGKATPVEMRRVARLEDEFVHGAHLGAAARREDPPVVRFQEADWGFTGDAALQTGGAGHFSAASVPARDGTAWGRTALEASLRYADWAVYDTRYVVSLEEQEGRRTAENSLSSRERNWRGLTSNNDRAYVAVERGRLRLGLGRDYVAWGMQRGEELLVSDRGVSLDALQFRLHLDRFRLSSVAALLSSRSNRYYSAHRLEVQLGRVVVGMQESVVYVAPHLEPTYLFPLSYYYGNQFNERENDNVFLGFDAKWGSPVGVLDAELLVDDFIYDGDPAPQKLGIRLGWRRAFEFDATDLDLQVDYLAIARWTFTHLVDENAYVAGSGSLDDGDPSLGHPLGPDADRLRAGVRWSPDRDWTWTLLFERTRRGEGNRDLSAWRPGEPYRLTFPSGEVRNENWLRLGSRFRLARRTEIQASAGYGHTFEGRQATLQGEVRLDF